jgi:hypothetical protein
MVCLTTLRQVHTYQIGADSHILGNNEPFRTGELDKSTDKSFHDTDNQKEGETEEDFILYPPRLLGYSTKEKVWGQFNVSSTTNVKPASLSLFADSLQLDENYKKMIESLVTDHGGLKEGSGQSDKVRVKDVVDGKGKGLVLLFHGIYLHL